MIGRRNVLLLAASQAATLSAMVMSMALAAILGGGLAPDRGLATLPIAAMVIGTAIASLPAAMLMRRHGPPHALCGKSWPSPPCAFQSLARQ